MSGCCSDSACGSAGRAMPPDFRRALWIALWANLAMFGVELAAGWRADSVSLLADAVDFFGGAANYGLSLAVLALAAVWRARAALVKGLSMGVVGAAALPVNVAVMLAAFGVSCTHRAWPDLAVAAIMAMLGLRAAHSVLEQARRELHAPPRAVSA
ncbi:MAG: cation transporter [Solimonas sp.]